MAVLSFIVSVMAGLAAGWIVYFIMLGGLRMPQKATDTTIVKTTADKIETESLLDRFGVMCFRVANRIVISTLGGALVALALGKPKARRA